MDFIKKIIPYDKTSLPKWFWLGTLVLGLIGFINAGYLTIEHFSVGDILCPLQGGIIDCIKVNTSVYSEFFSIPIALLGTLYYFFVVVLILFLIKPI